MPNRKSRYSSASPMSPASAVRGQLRPRRSPQREAILTLGALAGLAGTVWVIYGRAVSSPFIFDDRVSVVENPSIVRLWPPIGNSGRPGPLNPGKDNATSGRPLVNLSLALNYHFG